MVAAAAAAAAATRVNKEEAITGTAAGKCRCEEAMIWEEKVVRQKLRQVKKLSYTHSIFF